MKKIDQYLSLLLVCVFACSTIVVSGQTKKAYIEAADKAMEERDYYSAMVYYRNVLEFGSKSDSLEYLYKAAQAGSKINAYSTARDYYQLVMDKDESGEYPMASYELARLMKRTGQYEQAKSAFEIFRSEYDGDDTRSMEFAASQMDDLTWAAERVETPWEEYELEHLGDGVNTEDAEFDPNLVGDSLYFGSLRFDDPNMKQPAPKLASILLREGEGQASRIGQPLFSEEVHVAHTAITKDEKRMFFTQCEYVTHDSIRCDIYYRDRAATSDDWGAPMVMDAINSPAHTSTQPSVGYDADGTSYLFFASNREGGQGGMDLYRVAFTADGSFGQIEALDEVNTASDEMTPFLHESSQLLYFSSDGYPTLGGLDIFKYPMREVANKEVQHLGYPVNTSYNDLYYRPSEDGKEAYFSSNRPPELEGTFLDTEIEACCYDIWRADILPAAKLIAQTFSADTRDSLYGTQIELINLSTGERIVLQDDALASGVFPLERDVDYLLIGSKQGYIPDSIPFNTKELTSMDDIVKQLYLRTDVLTLDAYTFDARTREALKGATVTVYDMDDPDAEPMIISNWEGNDFAYELERGKRYRVTATRKGYTSESVIIDTNDHWDKSKIRQDFYLKIGDLGDFLPLVLYFDNDHPNPDTWLEESSLEYTETYPPYYAKKDVFVDRYVQPLRGSERETAAQQLMSFFDTEVKKGNDDLRTFLEVLEAHLIEGDRVNISLKGYTSPRSFRAYNYALGKRRVSSVLNNFMRYDNGALRKYIDSGQLSIGQESFGETRSPKGINASFENERESIYSYEASKERRVEIVQIEVN